jgi:hypothetical protein
MRQLDARYTAAPVGLRPSLWRQRAFVVLWTGHTISLVGSAVTTVALPLAAIAMLKASTFQVGLRVRDVSDLPPTRQDAGQVLEAARP